MGSPLPPFNVRSISVPVPVPVPVVPVAVEADAIVAALSFLECVLRDMEVGDSGVPFPLLCASPRRSFVLSGTSTSRDVECNREANEPLRTGVAVLLRTVALRRASGESTIPVPVPVIDTAVGPALGGEGGGEAGVVTFGRVCCVFV